MKADPLRAYHNYEDLVIKQFEGSIETDIKKAPTKKPSKAQTYYNECPNNRESLGFFTWNFLHTTAIYYP